MNLIFGKIFLITLILGMSSCGGNDSSKEKQTTSNPTTQKTSENSSTTKKKKKILFFGDSLTAGYGLDDPSKCYVGAFQNILDSLGLDYTSIASGESGETSSGGEERIDWVLENYDVDVFVLELGANDGMRGIVTEATAKNLQSIFDKVKAKFPKAKLVIAGMLAPPNMGTDFTDKFATIFPKLAKENDAALIPFLLEGVGGIPELNLKDGIHPTVEGHKILAQNVWKILKDVL